MKLACGRNGSADLKLARSSQTAFTAVVSDRVTGPSVHRVSSANRALAPTYKLSYLEVNMLQCEMVQLGCANSSATQKIPQSGSMPDRTFDVHSATPVCRATASAVSSD